MSETTLTTLGQRIAAKRKELGLSQSALGEQLGVSRQSIFKWESDAAIPEIDKLISLSRLFSVSISWLLGIEQAPSPRAEEPDFTEREKKLLEQLASKKPSVPRWMKWLTVGAAFCAAAALAVSCAGLALGIRSGHHVQAVQEQLHRLGETLGQTETRMLTDFTCRYTPSLDMTRAQIRFDIAPYVYHPENNCTLLVTLGGQEVGRYACQWNGATYQSAFELSAADGYSFAFCLEDSTGLTFSQTLDVPRAENLGDSLRWPQNYSVTWDALKIREGTFTFSELAVEIPLPSIFRGETDLWEQCELVLTDGSGTELNRFDLMHRSNHSAQIDFSGSDVSFTSQSISITFPEPGLGTELHLTLEGALKTGHRFLYPVETWKMTQDGLTTNWDQPKT